MITGEYDYTDQEVYEMTCECPAYYSYNGGANTVLLEYMESCCAESGNRPCTQDWPGEYSNRLQINCQGNNRREYCKIAGKEDGSC